jgi:hypothetical protein
MKTKFEIACAFYHPDKRIEELTKLEKDIIAHRLAGVLHYTDWLGYKKQQ